MCGFLPKVQDEPTFGEDYGYMVGPRSLLISWMSRGIKVTLFEWIAHRYASDKKHTM